MNKISPELAATELPGATPAASAEAAKVFGGRFHVTSKLGEGGMGVVYEALDSVLGRRVAVKVLRSVDAAFCARFLTEAKIVAQLSTNPHVVTIYDLGQTPQGEPFLVMERLEGQTLRDVIASSNGRASRTWVFEVGGQICAALADAHAKGVVHRDLKPENIFVVETQTLPTLTKVLDFGVAKSEVIPLAAEHATNAGAVVGTPAYLAPEVIAGQPATAAADVYALGITLYELATGTFPYRVDTPYQLIIAHAMQSPLPWADEKDRPTYPASFKDAVLAALSKAPADRPSIRDLWRAISMAESEVERDRGKV